MFYKNQKGVALVYVLMSLVAVGAIGMMVLHLANKETADSSLRASSEMSRFAANAGLTYATNFFSEPKQKSIDSSLNILKHWYTKYQANDIAKVDEKYRWIAGSEKTYLDTNDMKFRVKIVNMDFSELRKVTPPDADVAGRDNSYINILFESESVDSSGGKAKAFGSYKLVGYEANKPVIVVPRNALYLGGGADVIQVPIEVIGDTYMGGAGLLNSFRHVFDGEFRRYGNSTDFQVQGTTFKGPVYFGEEQGAIGNTKVKFVTPTHANYSMWSEEERSTKFKEGVGAESKMDMVYTSQMYIEHGAFFNNDATFQSYSGGLRFVGDNTILRVRNGKNYGSVGKKGYEGLYDGGVAPSLHGFATEYSMSLFDSLNISSATPPSFTIDTATINQFDEIITTINGRGNNVTGGDLNALYDSYPYPMLNNEWMVIRWNPSGSGRPFSREGDGFARKMILIIDKTDMDFSSEFYQSATTGISLIIIQNGAKALGNDGLIRGLIANTGTRDALLRTAGLNMKIQGALYSNTGKLALEGSPYGTAGDNEKYNKITIEYDESVLKEIAELGILDFGESNDNPPEIQRIPADVANNIPPKTSLLSRSF